MFGKVIELKRRGNAEVLGEHLPPQITDQFNSEVLDQGLRLSEASRISHINFGRESYFGLVTDSNGKHFSVHVALDPETKVMTRASCACFRSSTRTYCHHIVSFVRYILRPDAESARLRTLGEDFEESFWHDLAWYGYKHFGDSILGFKADVDHGAGGLRISFFDRTEHEVLAFAPGQRLVEEFLHEFFDIIRRDIDPVLFKRMFGKKLKDPKVPSLRRRPWTATRDEEYLHKKGLKTGRQQMEESVWHRITKVAFLIAGRNGGEFRFSYREHKNQLIVQAFGEDEELILRVVPPQSHIGSVIEVAEKRGIIGHDLLIHPVPLKTGYRITLTESSSLAITPVVENPDVEAPSEDSYLDRTAINAQLFGSYYYFPDWGFFRIDASGTGLPSEYFSPQKQTVVDAEQITEFLQQYGAVIENDPDILVDDAILSRRIHDTYASAEINHKAFSDTGVSVEVVYDFGDFSVPFSEIYDARKQQTRYVVRGDQWVDTLSPAFAWMDAVDLGNRGSDSTVTMSRTDYLRFLALHENVEKRFSSARLREWFQELEGLKPPSRLPSTQKMKGKLRAYQRNGYGWLWFLYENSFSGLLCDDMGLGKTHQVMALMTGILHRLENRPAKIRFLVICPTTVLGHWEQKVREYSPHLDPYVYHGTDRSFQEAFEEHRLIITSYGVALRDIEMFADYRFELIVLDEVQAIKNKSTKTYAAVKALNAVATIGLTGTPIENSLRDLKALFDIILPGYLLSDSQFETQFRLPIEEEHNPRMEERLSLMINPFMLRRKKEQVLTELPPKIEDVRRCSLSDDQIRFYKDIVENQGRELVSTLKDPDQNVPYIHVFAVLNYLKQICDQPALLEGETQDYSKYASGKWDLFVDLLHESLDSGQKVVVFSQYVKMLALIESYLKDHGIGFATIKGHTRKRAEQVNTFNQDPDCRVFTASLRASGLGIDLTAASVVIHYDRWWNSAREEQATDRVHRIGQRRGVHVFKLVTHNTLEEKIDRIIAKKKQLMESVVKQDDQTLLKHFSREELIDLISY